MQFLLKSFAKRTDYFIFTKQTFTNMQKKSKSQKKNKLRVKIAPKRKQTKR